MIVEVRRDAGGALGPRDPEGTARHNELAQRFGLSLEHRAPREKCDHDVDLDRGRDA